MSIKIGSNLASLNAQRRLAEATASLSTVFERLSSGQRINRASDDAAGLAIADDLKTKSRIYSQAIRNGNDGISILNIADSAVDALTSVVIRIRELSEQSANGSYSSAQRKALDNEAQELSKEFTRITQTTSFNGIKIFNGSLGSGLRLQLGIGTDESINASIGGAIGTGVFGTQSQITMDLNNSYASALVDINNDGMLDLITAGTDDLANGSATVRLGTGNGNFAPASYYTTESGSSRAMDLGDLNGDGILDLVTAGLTDANAGFATVRLGTGNGAFGNAISYSVDNFFTFAIELGDLNGDGILDLVTAGADSTLGNGTTAIRLGNGDGTFGTVSIITSDAGRSFGLTLADANNDGNLDIITAGREDSFNGTASIRFGSGNGTFGNVTTYTMDGNISRSVRLADFNSDGILDLVTAGRNDSGSGSATVRLGTGDGNFGSVLSYTTESGGSQTVNLGDLNGDGILDLITAGYNTGPIGSFTIRLGSGDGSFGNATRYSTEGSRSYSVSLGDLNDDGVLDIVTAGTNTSPTTDGKVSIRLNQTVDGLGALEGFSLSSRQSSLDAMSVLDKALNNLSKQRGQIGASESRVSIALNNLISARENFNAAESRIRDVDIAQESAALVRTQILQQAATSVLANANQQPQIAISLLQ